MARPVIRRIYIQDVIDAEGNVDGERLLYPMNTFMESTYSLLDGGLRFGDNIAGQIRELTFTTASTYTASNTFTPLTFLTTINKRPEGVLLMQLQEADNPSAIITSPVYIHWREITNKISIDFVTGLSDSTSYKLRVMVV